MNAVLISDVLPTAVPANGSRVADIRKDSSGAHHLKNRHANSKSDRTDDTDMGKTDAVTEKKVDRVQSSQPDGADDFGQIISSLDQQPAPTANDQLQNASVAPPIAGTVNETGAMLEKNSKEPISQNNQDSDRTILQPRLAIARSILQAGASTGQAFNRLANSNDVDVVDDASGVRGQAGPVSDANANIERVSLQQVKLETRFNSSATVTINDSRMLQPVAARAIESLNSLGKNFAAKYPVAKADVNDRASGKIASSLDSVEEGNASTPPTQLEAKQQSADYPVTDEGGGRSSSGDTSRTSADVTAKRNTANFEADVIGNDSAKAAAVVSPAQQVGTGIIDALGEASTNSRPDYVSMFADRPVSRATTSRTLELALEPLDLGNVRVRMNLSGSDLKIEIEAAKAETARMISNDRSGLDKNLRDVGLDLTSMSVFVSPTDVTAPASSAQSMGSQQQSQQGSNSAGQGAPMSFGNQSQDQRRSSHDAQLFVGASLAAEPVAEALHQQSANNDRARYV